MTVVSLDVNAPPVSNIQTFLEAWLDYGQLPIKVPSIEIIEEIKNLEQLNKISGKIIYKC